MNRYYRDSVMTEEYFGWNNSCELTSDVFGADNITNEGEFRCYVNETIIDFLKNRPYYNANIILVKTFYDKLRKIDHYKKIWKLDFTSCYSEEIENKREIYIEHKNYNSYFGMAEIKKKYDFDYYKFLNDYLIVNAVLFSTNEYRLEQVEAAMFLNGSKKPEIDYQNFCECFCSKGDTVLRFGSDSTGKELELIYHK